METLDRLIELLDPQPGERILDAGCGMGGGAARLAAAGARVTGIDILGVLLEQARFAHPECEFIEADLLDYEPAAAYDAVLAHATLHWIQPPRKAAGKLFGCLRPGGRLAVSLGGAAESARQLEGYYCPEPEEYRKVLKKAGFCEIGIEEGPPGPAGRTLMITARRPG